MKESLRDSRVNVTFGLIREDISSGYCLTFDFDVKHTPAKASALVSFVSAFLDRVSVDFWQVVAMESSGGKIHIAVSLRERMSGESAIVIQLACGSDPYRERLNARRYLMGVEDWSYLFEKKLKSEMELKEWQQLNQQRAKKGSRGARARTLVSKKLRKPQGQSGKRNK